MEFFIWHGIRNSKQLNVLSSKISERRTEMFTIALYVSTVCLLLASLFKDLKRTKMALKKSWKALENIMPQFLLATWSTKELPLGMGKPDIG